LNSGNAGINGIRWISGKSFHVESCTIFGFNSSAIDIEKADGGKAFITNSVLTNNALAGVLVKNTANTVAVTVSKSVIADNVFGIASQDFSHTVVFESEISGSSNTGLQTAISAGGTATMDVFNTVVANNSLGMSANASSTINISGVGFFGNSVSMVSPGTINTAHNNPNTGTGSPNGVTPIPVQ
jgi:hypothetical protein